MRIIVKIILSILAFVVYGFIVVLIKEATGKETNGIVSLAITAAFIFGVIAIWKNKPNKSTDTDIHLFDKD